MEVRTTLHLDAETAKKLDREAKARGISRSDMVIFLAHRLMQRVKQLSSFMGCVRYQKSDKDTEWKNVHISLDSCNHAFLAEMRCFYRFSVSALIAMELNVLLSGHNLMSTNNKSNRVIDNYNFYGRIMMVKKHKMFIKWKLFWNIPTDPERIFTD